MDEKTAVRQKSRAVPAPHTETLFEPYRLGPFNLPHRIVMAPLTLAGASTG
jgi:N-ethylmaleimide reductase